MEKVQIDFRSVASIKDQTFENVVFDSLDTSTHTVEIRNTVFKDCKVMGSVWFGYGATLESVEFINLRANGVKFDSEAHVRFVTFSGNMFSPLVARPLSKEEYTPPEIPESEWILDINNYEGNVIIRGWPSTAILRDPNRYFGVAPQLPTWIEEGRLASLGVTSNCWDRSAIRNFGKWGGVATLPEPEDGNYEQVLKEADILREHGLVLD